LDKKEATFGRRKLLLFWSVITEIPALPGAVISSKTAWRFLQGLSPLFRSALRKAARSVSWAPKQKADREGLQIGA